MNFCVFSFYTENTPYEDEIHILETSCRNLKIPFQKSSIPSSGKWVNNTMHKPKLILEFMEKTKYDAVVWVDADGVFKEYPQLFVQYLSDKVDFAVFRMGSRYRVTSGTIYLANNDRVKSFVNTWKEFCEGTKKPLGDQACLRKIIKKGYVSEYQLKREDLPYSYCYVFDDSLRMLSDEIEPLQTSPVIIHNQASRRFKRDV
jgi:hypothetical protein